MKTKALYVHILRSLHALTVSFLSLPLWACKTKVFVCLRPVQQLLVFSGKSFKVQSTLSKGGQCFTFVFSGLLMLMWMFPLLEVSGLSRITYREVRDQLLFRSLAYTVGVEGEKAAIVSTSELLAARHLHALQTTCRCVSVCSRLQRMHTMMKTVL